MKIIRSLKSMQAHSRRAVAEGHKVGLVPTMGYLHEGHLSLIRKAAKAVDVIVTTIFVNPTQFAPGEDLEEYPRDEKRDLRRIRGAMRSVSDETEALGVVYIARAEEIYPEGFQTWVEVSQLTQSLEGDRRPTHFRGVTTVVAKLFNIIRPDIAVFGQKDYQQAAVLKRMTHDLGFPIKFVVAQTVRERDGLAMSSRNAYLDEQGRREALCLYRALATAREMVKSGVLTSKDIRREMRAVIKATCPRADIDYIEFTEFDSLIPVKKVVKNTICSLAVRLHGVRLIDNMKLG